MPRAGGTGGCTPREPSPVDEVEVFLQEARVHGTLAELQLRLGVVMHVVDAHLLQDAKAPLQGGEDAVSTGSRARVLPSAFGFPVVRCTRSLMAQRRGMCQVSKRPAPLDFPPSQERQTANQSASNSAGKLVSGGDKCQELSFKQENECARLTDRH